MEQEKEGKTRAKSEVLDRPRNHEESYIGLAQPIRDCNHAHEENTTTTKNTSKNKEENGTKFASSI